MKAKRMSLGVAGALFALLSLLLFVAACNGDDGDAKHEDPTATEPAAGDPTATEPAEPDPTATVGSETTIDVSLSEFVVDPSIDTAPAGTITFNVSSDGAIFHNFKVIATDLAPDALPFDDALFAVDEAQVDIVANTADLDPGEQETLTVELAAGSYVLICNIPTHYQGGMATAFTVE